MVYPGMVDYSGAFRNEPVSNTSKIVVGGIWLIVLLALLLLTTYDISYGRKEQSIRIILGADNKILKQKKIIFDLLGFSFSAILAFVTLLPFTTPEFELFTSLMCFVLILMANTVLLIWGMRIKQKAPFKKHLSNKVLGFSMGLKGLTAILTVIVLSMTFGLSIEGIKLYSQKGYYEAQKNMVHADIAYPYDYDKMELFTGASEGRPPLNTKEQVQDNFLRYSYNKLDCSLLYSHSYKKIAPRYGDKYIFANLQGLSSYKDFIPNWEELCANEGTYILLPEKYNVETVLNEFLSFGNILGISEKDITGIVTYKNGLSCLLYTSRCV